MAKCEACGAKLTAKSAFCGACGAPTGLEVAAKKTSSPILAFLLGVIALPMVAVAAAMLISTIGSAWTVRFIGSILLVLSVVSFFQFYKLPFPKTSSGKILSAWFALCFAFVSFGVESAGEKAARLAELKQNDPIAYLQQVKVFDGVEAYFAELQDIDPERYAAEWDAHQTQQAAARAKDIQRQLNAILQDDPTRWMNKVEELDPEQYRTIMSDKQRFVSDLAAQARALPASDIRANMRLYGQLVSLEPETENFSEKYAHYKAKVVRADWVRKTCTLKSSEAGVYAQSLVKQTLKAPRSAKFPWLVEGTHQGDCVYVVSSYVDAQNSFGAMLRQNFTVRLQRTRNGWTLINYDMS